MDQSPATIVEAVESCVAYSAGEERPFQNVSDFLAVLKRAGWSTPDIARVQSLAVAELIKRRELPSGAASAAESP